MSEANSGGVFSNVDFIPSTIELTGSLSASLTSDEEICIVFGSPDIKSLPLISISISSPSL